MWFGDSEARPYPRSPTAKPSPALQEALAPGTTAAVSTPFIQSFNFLTFNGSHMERQPTHRPLPPGPFPSRERCHPSFSSPEQGGHGAVWCQAAGSEGSSSGFLGLSHHSSSPAWFGISNVGPVLGWNGVTCAYEIPEP